MSSLIERQLAEYGLFHEERQGAVDIDSVFEPVTPIPMPDDAGRRGGRGWLVAVGAGAAAILVAGLVPFLLSSSTDGEPGDTAVTTSSVAPSTTVPDESAPIESTTIPTTAGESNPSAAPVIAAVETSVGRLVWTKYEGTGAGIPHVQLDIDGYIIGGLGDSLLFSDDGTNFTTVPSSPVLTDRRVFRSDGKWALTGQSMWESSGEARDLLRSNGTEWVKVDLAGVDVPWPDIPLQSGDVVVVPNHSDGDEGFWVSTNDGPFAFVEPPWVWPEDTIDPRFDHTILAAPDGGFVALLWVSDAHPDNRDLPDDQRDNASLVWAELWTSSNGLEWENHGLPAFIASELITTRTIVEFERADDRLFATLHPVDCCGGPLGVYSSTNGLDWQPDVPPSDGIEGVNRPTQDEYPGLQVTNFGYLDVERRQVSDSVTETIFWISIDGQTWEEIRPPLEQDGLFRNVYSGNGIGDLIYATFIDDSGTSGAGIMIGSVEGEQ